MTPLKAYIVDDEYLERTLLRRSIPWAEYGVEITGEAGSGRELLGILRKDRPDILLTDICMPCMDGLALARTVREQYRDVDIIILSGHRDFDYAKQAIRIGVTEYLLKPVDREELAAAGGKIRARRAGAALPAAPAPQEGPAGEQPGGIVGRATRCIADSLGDSDLSLRTVAEKLYVSASYLSRAFKQETGENLTDYVTRLRIVQSAEYLRHTSLKAYEIAEKTGFNDSHYFSLCFKKYMGKTVQEYRRECVSCGM